jgi:clan AA aspartic protease (TIGR02281 family)
MARVLLVSLALILASAPAFAQNPQDLMNQLIRQQQIEQQQRFEDQQRQRQLDQEETTYDRQNCLKAGYTGPDVEQCVRDSAAWRRGVRPQESSAPVDFSSFGTPAPNQPQEPEGSFGGSAPPTAAQSQTDVPLKISGGIFVVPIQINGAITLDFGVDSGAADVSIPLDVYSTLKRAGTIQDADVIGQRTYILADGSKSQSITFRIRSLRIGDKIVEGVTGSVAPSGGALLLGQSFLSRFKRWSIDNNNHKLVLETH